MKKTNRIYALITLCGLLFSYIIPLDTYAEDYNSSTAQSSNDSSSDTTELSTTFDEYNLNISEFTVKSSTAKADYISECGAINKYGEFWIKANDNGILKYKYNNFDVSKKYLVKGTASFSKLEVTFDGYFLVDNTLSGRKKGKMSLYKGKCTFPNGDKFDGTLSEGKYYSTGTYTWKNGMSYKGKFTKTNKLGSSKKSENKTSEYGYLYFDSTRKHYLYIRFINGVPYGTGYYYKSGKKYKVKYNDNGQCISTTEV